MAYGRVAGDQLRPFRTCSSDGTRSQAPFYLYARCPIANRAEGTFALLRSAIVTLTHHV